MFLYDYNEHVSRHIPSFRLLRLGACACEEMGALLAGVFWGVLESMLSVSVQETRAPGAERCRIVGVWQRGIKEGSAYGAVGGAALLLRMGSDMLTAAALLLPLEQACRWESGGLAVRASGLQRSAGVESSQGARWESSARGTGTGRISPGVVGESDG